MGEYEKEKQRLESKAIANNEGGSRELKRFVDNRHLNISQLIENRCIQSKNRCGILQRRIHLTGPVVGGFVPNNGDSHAYYHIANNNLVITSSSYASCVGLAI